LSKLPAFQFYPGDWQKEPTIKACSIAARGLWWEIICLLFESEQRGFLLISGDHNFIQKLARLTGTSVKQCSRLLNELETNKVFSRDDNNIIYCRRMVRDEHKRKLCVEAGKRGGNPALTLKGTVNYKDKQDANPNLTPSSSSSTSSSKIKEVKQILAFWNSSGFPVSKDSKAVSKALDGWSPDEIVDAISNYKLILRSEEFILETEWTLGVFLNSHIEKFLSLKKAEEFYKRRNGTNGKLHADVSPGEAYELLERKEAALSR